MVIFFFPLQFTSLPCFSSYLDEGFDGWIMVDPKDEEWMKVKVKNRKKSV